MDVLEMLEAKLGFTDTEIKIADYVLGHLYQSGGVSANALAKETFSSTASVIRMCRKMNFSGYREFQIALAARLSERESGANRAEGYDSAARAANPEAVMKRFSEAIATAAEGCFRSVSPESFLRAAVWMSRANRLYVYGADCFNALAFCHAMSALGIVSTVPDLLHEKPYRERRSLEGDAALFVTYSDCGFRKEMSLFRKRGCRVIAVSSGGAFPDADISLCFPKAETDCPQAQAAYAQAAFLYIASCINYMAGVVKSQ